MSISSPITAVPSAQLYLPWRKEQNEIKIIQIIKVFTAKNLKKRLRLEHV